MVSEARLKKLSQVALGSGNTDTGPVSFLGSRVTAPMLSDIQSSPYHRVEKLKSPRFERQQDLSHLVVPEIPLEVGSFSLSTPTEKTTSSNPS